MCVLRALCLRFYSMHAPCDYVCVVMPCLLIFTSPQGFSVQIPANLSIYTAGLPLSDESDQAPKLELFFIAHLNLSGSATVRQAPSHALPHTLFVSHTHSHLHTPSHTVFLVHTLTDTHAFLAHTLSPALHTLHLALTLSPARSHTPSLRHAHAHPLTVAALLTSFVQLTLNQTADGNISITPNVPFLKASMHVGVGGCLETFHSFFHSSCFSAPEAAF